MVQEIKDNTHNLEEVVVKDNTRKDEEIMKGGDLRIGKMENFENVLDVDLMILSISGRLPKQRP